MITYCATIGADSAKRSHQIITQSSRTSLCVYSWDHENLPNDILGNHSDSSSFSHPDVGKERNLQNFWVFHQDVELSELKEGSKNLKSLAVKGADPFCGIGKEVHARDCKRK